MSIADLAGGATSLDALAAAANGPTAGIQPPAGLPDVGALTKMANELFAALPGQSLPTSAGPSLPGFGASPVEVAGTSAPHIAAAGTSPLPTTGAPTAFGTPGSISPFDGAAFDDRVFDSLFAAVIPSAPSSAPSGPSLPGFGASPTELAGQAGAQSAPTQSSVPASAPGIGAPVTGAPVSAADVSVIDLAGVNTLTRTPDPLLPSSVDAGPSLSGFGASKGIPARPEQSRSADSLPGISQSAPPQPPPATPPPQVLSNHTGIETPHSGGTVSELRPHRYSLSKPSSSRCWLRLQPSPTPEFRAWRRDRAFTSWKGFYRHRAASAYRARQLPSARRLPAASASTSMRFAAIFRSSTRRSTAGR